jgi:hypothetical protein
MFTRLITNAKSNAVTASGAILKEMTFFKMIVAAAGLAALSATSAAAGAGAMTGLGGLATNKTTSASPVQKVHRRYRYHCHGYYDDFCHGGGGDFYIPECFLDFDYGVICLGDYGYSRNRARAAARAGRSRTRSQRRVRGPRSREFGNRGQRSGQNLRRNGYERR